MPFHGELGDNYLDIKNYIISGQIPLVGPASSHEWLRLGAFFYWIFGIILIIFKFDPVSGIYVSESVGVATVLITYFAVSIMFNKKTALVSSLLMAVSPQLLLLNNGSRFFSYIIPLSIIYYYLIYKIVKGSSGTLNYFLSAVILGITIHLHYTSLIFLPGTALVFYLNGIKPNRKQILFFFSGILILTVPFIIHTLTFSDYMLIKLIVWFPYKFMKAFNAGSESNILTTLSGNLQVFSHFISSNFILPDFRFGILFSAVIIFFLSGSLLVSKDSPLTILAIHFFSGSLLLFLHKTPPNHYFIPLQIIPFITFSYYLVRLTKFSGIIFSIIFIFIAALNMKFFFSDNWFYKNKMSIQNQWIPYRVQEQIADVIIADADNKPFNLKRVGSFDFYKDNYAMNYIYLLWWKGNEPKKYNTGLTYIIYDDPKLIPEDLSGIQFIEVANTKILKI